MYRVILHHSALYNLGNEVTDYDQLFFCRNFICITGTKRQIIGTFFLKICLKYFIFPLLCFFSPNFGTFLMKVLKIVKLFRKSLKWEKHTKSVHFFSLIPKIPDAWEVTTVTIPFIGTFLLIHFRSVPIKRIVLM